MKKYDGSHITYVCKGCGNSFTDYASNHRVFCSYRCRSSFVSTHFKHPLLVDRITLTCQECGNQFVRTSSYISRNRGMFCSTKCRYKAMQGAGHPLWTGGTKDWRGTNWDIKAKEALSRDNFTCQHCGKTNKEIKLHTHHIIPYALFDGDWERANDLNNLITLCVSCHSKVEYKLAHPNT